MKYWIIFKIRQRFPPLISSMNIWIFLQLRYQSINCTTAILYNAISLVTFKMLVCVYIMPIMSLQSCSYLIDFYFVLMKNNSNNCENYLWNNWQTKTIQCIYYQQTFYKKALYIFFLYKIKNIYFTWHLKLMMCLINDLSW